MSINKIILLLIPISFLFYVNSCSTVRNIFGKNAKTEEKAKTKIEDVQKAQSQNVQSKMDQVAVLASGTDYAINKITNREPPVFVAKDINNRVISLAGKPSLDAEKEMWKTIDDLTSQVVKEKQMGLKALQKKDKEISDLQEETKTLTDAKNTEIDKYMKLASDTALKADTLKSELQEYTGWFGLKGVLKGLWQFVKSMTWILGGLGILFLILRGFASTNPIIGAIFGIFEQIAAWIIHLIQTMAPRAASFADFIPKKTFDGYKQTLTKIIDQIQFLKHKDPEEKYTVGELCATFKLDSDDTDRVDNIKKELNYR